MSLSIWEKESLINYDYVIIGAGIVGLAVALTLKQKIPRAEIVILERGVIPTGATTKNAGFACFGSLTELLADYAHSPEHMLSTVQMRWEGLQLLKEKLGVNPIGYEATGGFELIPDTREEALQNLDKMNTLLSPVVGAPEVFRERKELVSKFGFQNITTIIENKYEGILHSGKLFRTLYQKVCELGCIVLSGANVTHIDVNSSLCQFWVNHIHPTESLCFSAPKGCVCTNAFTRQFFPELAIEPGRGQVLITEPLPYVPFRGGFHMEEGYYYFRNVGNRVLLGGGRHLARTEEATTAFGTTPFIQEKLENLLQKIILPKIPYKVDYRWSGIMAFGPEKAPIIKNVSNGLWVAARMSGMGVAIAFKVAEILCSHLVD
ncbi:MAG: FAD-binding oxidoreductase [Bacteroidia bacterium]|nr:FAD-binding oxidoreductase [Bacteroidia bacterium]